MSEETSWQLDVPEEYVFVVLVAFYLLWEFRKKVEVFEAETILVQAVLVNNLTIEDIDEYPTEFHLGALNLSGCLAVILSHLVILNSVCGNPFSRMKVSSENIFDGKIMHCVYGRMKRGQDPLEFFHQKEHMDLFGALKKTLYKLGRICGHVNVQDLTLNEKNQSINNNNNNYIIKTNETNNNRHGCFPTLQE